MVSLAIQFKKAVKYDARGRAALVGPAGSGKSFTALKLARLLAGPKGRIAALDTEHGSLSKYADLFEFDVFELGSYSPDNFMAALDAAEAAKYDVFVVDSLSHFWVGKDGALEFVDAASRRHRDQMSGWKDFRPHERAMVDRMIASPCHVLVTMRTKTEYVEEINPNNGKKQRKKVGLQPVQREGLEYEFDLVGYMDEDNTFIVDKTRCPAYASKVIAKPSEKDFQAFCDWLKGAKQREGAPQNGNHATPQNWDPSKVKHAFAAIERRIGHVEFLAALAMEGYTSVDELSDRNTAAHVYKTVLESTKDLPDAPKNKPLARPQTVEQPVPPATPNSTPTTTAAQASSGKGRVETARMPAEVEALWKRIIDSKSLCTAFSELKADLIEVAGQQRAEHIYRNILANSGVEHLDQFRHLGHARQTASALWKAIREVANEPPLPDADETGDPFTDGETNPAPAHMAAAAKETT
jgi:hypothetical protein